MKRICLQTVVIELNDVCYLMYMFPTYILHTGNISVYILYLCDLIVVHVLLVDDRVRM